MEKESSVKKKICPSCHTVFSCFDDNCWCSKLPLVMPFSINAECLCPDCLKSEIEKKSKQSR